MSWKKAPDELVDTFEAVRPGPPAVHKQMFGFPCCFVNGNMFMGLHEDRMVLRLDEVERGRLLAMEGAQPFEPMPGRPMKEYVVVPGSLLGDRVGLAQWVGKSLAFAASLPPKGKGATPRASKTPPAKAAPATKARATAKPRPKKAKAPRAAARKK
jgi:TfoX/Sxy family transcriptional regulator of competence genes